MTYFFKFTFHRMLFFPTRVIKDLSFLTYEIISWLSRSQFQLDFAKKVNQVKYFHQQGCQKKLNISHLTLLSNYRLHIYWNFSSKTFVLKYQYFDPNQIWQHCYSDTSATCVGPEKWWMDAWREREREKEGERTFD